MARGSQFSNNCSNLTVEDLISINLSFSSAGGVCCLISITIVMLLLICRAYKTVLQRLFLYLMVATTARELLLAASFEHQFEYSGQDSVCTWIGFIYNWTEMPLFVFTVGILVHLFFLVWLVAKGNTVPYCLQSKRWRVSLEVLYVALTLTLTLAFASVPYFTNDYGLSGGLCWINSLDENCDTVLSGLLAQLFQGYLFHELGGVIGIIITIAVAMIYCKLSSTVHEAKQLITKTFVVLICFLLSLIVVNVFVSLRAITTKLHVYNNFEIWFLVGITYPITLLLFPATFLLSFYPVSKACKLVFLKARRSVCFHYSGKKKRTVYLHKVHACSTHIRPTLPESSRVSAPSYTFFEVPYTNNFTHITTDNNPLLVEEQADTGYGSVTQQ